MNNDRVTGGLNGIKERVVAVVELVYPMPVSVEVFSNNRDEMIRQAREISSWSNNIIVKVPIHGPNGELHNMEVIHVLENKYDVRVNTTAMMSAQQCYVAALAGSTYVSIFGGRVNNMGHSAIEEISRVRKLIDSNSLKSKIIVGSTREILNVSDWLLAGAHIVTVTPELLEGLIVHPYTKETVKMFLKDATSLLAEPQDNAKKN
jgi:transaldolase